MDYRDFKPKKDYRPDDEKSAAEELAAGYWWAIEDPTEAGFNLYKSAESLEQNSNSRHMLNLVHARLYGNFDIAGFGARDYNRIANLSLLNNSTAKLSLNVVASCIDTLAAKICKNKPRPMFVTSGASWPMQQKAKKLNQFGNALFHETKIHEAGTAATMDKYMYGTGALHAYIDRKTKKLKFERAFIDDFLVDDADGVYANPRQLIRKKLVNRASLLKAFPQHADIISEANTRAEDKPIRGNVDMCEVWEAWYLPSYKGAGDGRHMTIVSTGCLEAEEWKLDCFPFVFTRYRKRTLGFWGQGVAEILTGIQVSLNRTFRSIDEQIRRKGKGRIVYPINSVDPALFDNSVAAHIPFKGNIPPIFDNSPAVSQDELAHAQNLYQKAFQEVGISELSAASKKPSGLDAAVALREFNDIETERFILEGKGHEQMYMDAMELALELIRATGGAGYKVKLPNKRYLVEIDWKEIDLERDQYVLQMFPVSSLPSTPAARLQRVEELRAGGYIDMPTAKRLLDFPDIDAEMNLANSSTDDVDACISMILDDAKPEMPPIEVYQNLDMIIERATTSYLFAKHHDCDEERLRMLRDYINAATDMKVKSVQAMAPPPMAPGGDPSGLGPVPAPETGGGQPSMTQNVNVPLQPAVPPIVGQ